MTPRPLSEEERVLVEAMLLSHGEANGAYLVQLPRATVVQQCPCGCASVEFLVDGIEPARTEPDILADSLYGDVETGLFGTFVYAREGRLAGLEVYALNSKEIPSRLPAPSALRPFSRRPRDSVAEQK